MLQNIRFAANPAHKSIFEQLRAIRSNCVIICYVQDSYPPPREISVIVPVYNSEQYLSDCIKSILNQTFTDFELILVNDGSLDSSLEICERFAEKDSRIVLIDKKNEGVSEARNTGIKDAKGRYICFVDSDDVLLPHYLRTLVDTQRKYNSQLTISGISLIQNGKITEFKSEECVNDKNEFFNLFSLSEDLFLLRGPVCKLFDLSVIKAHHLAFDKSVHYGEDTIFVLQYCLYIDSLAFCDDVSYQYFRRGDGLVCSKPRRSDTISEIKAFNNIFGIWAKRFDCNANNIAFFNGTMRLIYQRFFSATTDGYSYREYIDSYKHIDARTYSKLFSVSTTKGKIYSVMLHYAPRLLGSVYYFRQRLKKTK